jgi:CRP/FNR family cyclic AMP-dependent transcriptional regulator
VGFISRKEVIPMKGTYRDQSVSPWIENLAFDWESLASLGQRIQVKKDENVFIQEIETEYVYVIEEGRVRLFMTSRTGEEKHIAIIGKNGMIGECGVYDKNTYICSAAASSGAVLIRISLPVFLKALDDDASLMKQVLSMSQIKFQILLMHTLQLSFSSAFQRIADSLIHLAVKYGEAEGNHTVITVPFTHQEMANLVGTSRVTVANVMKQMQNEGVLRKEMGKYVILKMEKLQALLN